MKPAVTRRAGARAFLILALPGVSGRAMNDAVYRQLVARRRESSMPGAGGSAGADAVQPGMRAHPRRQRAPWRPPQRRGIVLTQLMRLKQICNHPSAGIGTNDYRADRAASRANAGGNRRGDRLPAKRRCSFSPSFARSPTRWPNSSPHSSVAHLDCSTARTSVPKRKEYVDRFQREDGPPLLQCCR